MGSRILGFIKWLVGGGLVSALLLTLVFMWVPGFQKFVYASLQYDLSITMKRSSHYDEWTGDQPPKLVRIKATNDLHIHGTLAVIRMKAVSSAPGLVRSLLPPADFEIDWLLFAVSKRQEKHSYPYQPVPLVLGVPPSDGGGLVVRLGKDASTSRCYWYMWQRGGSTPFSGEMSAFKQGTTDRFVGNCLPSNVEAYLSPHPLRLDDSVQIPLAIFVDRRFPGTYEIDVSLGYSISVGLRRFERIWPRSADDRVSAHFTIVYNPESEVPQNPDPSKYAEEEWRHEWLKEDEDRRKRGGDEPPPCLHSPTCFALGPGQPERVPFFLGGGWPGPYFVAPDLPPPQPVPIPPISPRPPDMPKFPHRPTPRPHIEPPPEPILPRPPIPILPAPWPRPLPVPFTVP